jgi:type IV secretion system protein VirD4
MGFLDGVRRGRDAAVAERRGQRPPPRPGPRPSPPPAPPAPADRGRADPSAIKFGYYLTGADQTGGPLFYHGERHAVLFGLNGAGKSTRILIELLMTVSHRSLFVFDIKGELAAMTAAERRRFGKVKIINPYHLHGMRSDGFEPLAQLRCDDPLLYDKAAAIADALIEIEGGSGQYWSESAQGLLAAVIMWEVILAHREHRAASLLNVRLMMTEAEQYKTYVDADGRTRQRLAKGLTVTAARMIAEGGPVFESLIGRFVRREGQNELAGIQSTADTQTQWMLSDAFKGEFGRNDGVNFRELHQGPEPVTCYAVLPAEQVSIKRKWTRVALSTALSAHFEPGPLKTLFILDEFRASVGSLKVINDVWSLVRGYGVQLMPILQSALQLKALFKDEWENYIAQAGAVATLGPPGDMFTAEWMSKRCGVTTVAQESVSLNNSVTSGDSVSDGTGESGNGRSSSNRGRGANTGQSSGGSLSIQQMERAFLQPNELMDMANGHGRLWVPGLGTASIPFFAPEFWNRQAPWVQRVKPNPYR